ncbi:MAG TPA: 2OG-Fe(II) oxygenase [Acidimicrobiales bacterium]|nr:2OG-Fe(II) oxygenase [Acidimicrobiales bacterium]
MATLLDRLRGRRSRPDDRRRIWPDVDAEDLDGHADAIEAIYEGRLDGMTIKGVFTPSEARAVVERLEQHRSSFVDHGSVEMFGTAIVGSEDDRADYHRDAPGMNPKLEALFDGRFRSRIEEVLGRVGGGRPVDVPQDGADRPYVPATVRVLPSGRGVIHGHTANEFCNVWPAYAHLRDIARMWNSLSYFIVAQPPEDGGELVLYDLDWDDTPEAILALPMGPERDALLERSASQGISPKAGDMVLFTGGRIWHRVAPVRGTVPRVTVGGFVALSAEGDRIYYWS